MEREQEAKQEPEPITPDNNFPKAPLLPPSSSLGARARARPHVYAHSIFVHARSSCRHESSSPLPRRDLGDADPEIYHFAAAISLGCLLTAQLVVHRSADERGFSIALYTCVCVIFTEI